MGEKILESRFPMIKDNTKRNLTYFYFFLIPIIIAAKYIRWIVMRQQLINVSIGWGMALMMNRKNIPFSLTLLSLSDTVSVVTDNAMAFFQSINLFQIETFIGWEIFISALFNIFILFSISEYYRNNPRAGWKENLFIYLGVGTLNIFCFSMAKEPYQMLFFFLCAYAIKKPKTFKNKIIALTITVLFTILLTRKYYGLMLLYFFAILFSVSRFFKEVNLTDKKGKKKFYRNLLLMVILFAVFHFVLMSFISNVGESTYDDLITMNYRDQNRLARATSEIVPLFNPDNRFLVTADYLIKIFRLSIPIELLFIGKYTYVFTIIFQLLLLTFIIRAFKKRDIQTFIEKDTILFTDNLDGNNDEDYGTNGDNQLEAIQYNREEVIKEEHEEHEDEEEEEDEDYKKIIQQKIDTRTVALYLYLAYLLCSASFEPDFGSWSRHQGVFFPILLLIL